jgi:hypothetical protein
VEARLEYMPLLLATVYKSPHKTRYSKALFPHVRAYIFRAIPVMNRGKSC